MSKFYGIQEGGRAEIAIGLYEVLDLNKELNIFSL
ncbi:hypothetical protein TUMEXPCC7403_12045 [Tumidithrix helvetica PCC 7403]